MGMGRKRQGNFDLPPRMHFKDGSYYHVSSMRPRKWTKLHKELPKARILWATIENGEGNSSTLFNTRLDEYLVSKKFLALADTTRAQYEGLAIKLKEFFRGATVEAITPAHIALWMDNYPSEIQANTGKSIISNVFRIAVRHGLVNHNPCLEIQKHHIEGRDRYITDQEYRAIWDSAEPHVRVAMDIGYLTGSRIGDILDIKKQDIAQEGIYIRQGKTKKKMLFLMSDALEELLERAYALPRPILWSHLICGHSGRPIRYDTFNLHWLHATRKAGIPDNDLIFHDIRGKAATDAKALGLDYQALLGHATRAMSDKYIRLREVQRVMPIPMIGRSS